jgi:diguanylate cyclase (GGDEF)-like protein/PAS domain S-box-containing protein
MPDLRPLIPNQSAAAPGRGVLEVIAELAANMLNAPIAVVALMAPDGSWQNSSSGLDPAWRRRELPEAADVLACEGLFTRSYEHDGHPIGGVRFVAALRIGEPAGLIAVYDRHGRTFGPGESATLESIRTLAADAFRQATPDDTNAHDILFTLDLGGHLTGVHGGFGQTGYSEHELIGSHLLDLVPEDHRETARDRLLAQLGDGTVGSFDLALRTKNGAPVLFKFRTRLLFESGKPAGIEASGRDITGPPDLESLRREAELKLWAKTEQLARFGEHLREMQRISVAPSSSLDDLCSQFLEAGCSMFSLPAGRLLDENGRQFAAYPTEFAGTFYPVLTAKAYSGDQAAGTIVFGSAAPEKRNSDALDRDLLELMAQSVGHAILTHRLQSKLGEAARHLERQLRVDTLTGVSNRLGLLERLGAAIERAQASDESVCVLFIDLDQFKQVNDTLGHAAGDELLRQVARRMCGFCGANDLVARMGGDEFALVIAGNPDRAGMQSRIRSLLDEIRQPYVISGYEIIITASVGATMFPVDGNLAQELLQRADAAMFRAKSHGKNDFQFFEPDMLARTLNRLQLEIQLRRAIENREFDIRFQPILSIEGEIEGLEVLLWWDNPTFGRVRPSRFIPIAEETGMIVPIGRWVLEQACLQNVAWQDAGYGPMRIAVNVSALQFARADFVETVAGVLKETGMPPQCLELELTESIVMRDTEENTRRMEQIRAIGVSMSIDDFGTGYSSLSYLRRLPVDSLKIDRSFLAELSSSNSSLPLIQTIVVLAHNMGLSVVAEGVETEEQFELLRVMGCDKVQGHLFSAPQPAAAIPALLDRRRLKD